MLYAGNLNLGVPCALLTSDNSDEPSLLCYESEPDEERMDENKSDMIETHRFEE